MWVRGRPNGLKYGECGTSDNHSRDWSELDHDGLCAPGTARLHCTLTAGIRCANISQVAEMAIGYSGAELANLLNEAAILAVRKNQDTIDLQILIEAMDKIKLGLRSAPLPDSTAKRRMAAVEAGRAVVLALTPGIPSIQHITIQPRGGVMGRILFEPLVRRKLHPISVFALHSLSEWIPFKTLVSRSLQRCSLYPSSMTSASLEPEP